MRYEIWEPKFELAVERHLCECYSIQSKKSTMIVHSKFLQVKFVQVITEIPCVRVRNKQTGIHVCKFKCNKKVEET